MRTQCPPHLTCPLCYFLMCAFQVGDCEVKDAAGRKIRMHADTPTILRALRGRGCGIAVASLNPDAERCKKLLAALGILTLLETNLIKVSCCFAFAVHLSQHFAAAACLRHRLP